MLVIYRGIKCEFHNNSELWSNMLGLQERIKIVDRQTYSSEIPVVNLEFAVAAIAIILNLIAVIAG